MEKLYKVRAKPWHRYFRKFESGIRTEGEPDRDFYPLTPGRLLTEEEADHYLRERGG